MSFWTANKQYLQIKLPVSYNVLKSTSTINIMAAFQGMHV